MEFGNTADSRILATGKAEARSWGINKVADTKGNYLAVTYINDSVNGQSYPDRIDYTGNSAASLAPRYSVRFVYNTARPDVMTAYFAGSFTRTTVLLTNVQTYAGQALVSDYRLTYNSASTGRMRLRTITMCGASGTCLPVTTIGWTTSGDLSSGFVASTIASTDSIPNLYQVHSSGDFNGDGLTDLYLNYTYDNGRSVGPGFSRPPQVWLSRGERTFNRLTLADTDNMPDLYQTFASGDFNGDGLTDLYINPARQDGRAWRMRDNFTFRGRCSLRQLGLAQIAR
jgi:hypothetical protein